jgi:hypothetical protein
VIADAEHREAVARVQIGRACRRPERRHCACCACGSCHAARTRPVRRTGRRCDSRRSAARDRAVIRSRSPKEPRAPSRRRESLPGCRGGSKLFAGCFARSPPDPRLRVSDAKCPAAPSVRSGVSSPSSSRR